MVTLGFIGTGNMGGALARAACKSIPSDQVFLANRTAEKARALAEELDCRVADNEAIAESADFIFLGVKPQMMAELLADIGPVLAKRESRFILVTMAAGLTIARIQELAQHTYLLIIEFQHIAPYERLLNDFPRIPVLSQVDIENLEGSHRSHSIEKIVYGLAGDSVALGQ